MVQKKTGQQVQSLLFASNVNISSSKKKKPFHPFNCENKTTKIQQPTTISLFNLLFKKNDKKEILHLKNDGKELRVRTVSILSTNYIHFMIDNYIIFEVKYQQQL